MAGNKLRPVEWRGAIVAVSRADQGAYKFTLLEVAELRDQYTNPTIVRVVGCLDFHLVGTIAAGATNDDTTQDSTFGVGIRVADQNADTVNPIGNEDVLEASWMWTRCGYLVSQVSPQVWWDVTGATAVQRHKRDSGSLQLAHFDFDINVMRKCRAEDELRLEYNFDFGVFHEDPAGINVFGYARILVKE